ncbi:MAG: hypothetical protein M3071_22545, partial [Actinomycetota bacterium]|nr:hypothetical protein [Actinomycetota bacterium]
AGGGLAPPARWEGSQPLWDLRFECDLRTVADVVPVVVVGVTAVVVVPVVPVVPVVVVVVVVPVGGVPPGPVQAQATPPPLASPITVAATAAVLRGYNI